MSDDKTRNTENATKAEEKQAATSKEAPASKDQSTYRIRDWASI